MCYVYSIQFIERMQPFFFVLNAKFGSKNVIRSRRVCFLAKNAWTWTYFNLSDFLLPVESMNENGLFSLLFFRLSSNFGSWRVFFCCCSHVFCVFWGAWPKCTWFMDAFLLFSMVPMPGFGLVESACLEQLLVHLDWTWWSSRTLFNSTDLKWSCFKNKLVGTCDRICFEYQATTFFTIPTAKISHYIRQIIHFVHLFKHSYRIMETNEQSNKELLEYSIINCEVPFKRY